MNAIADQLAAALRNMPDDARMIEHNPDEGMRLFCFDDRVVNRMRGDDTVQHATGCWYVAAREALAVCDAQPQPQPPRVCVRMERGLVQSVFSDVPVNFIGIDYDTEGADEDDLFAMPQGDGTTTDCYRPN